MPDDRLGPLLEEYKTLRSEIQYRTQIQNTVLQIHATVLTAILGAIVSQAYGLVPVFLVPIEASLFGSWYWDHGASILYIGKYLGVHTEPEINAITPRTVTWQTQAVEQAIAISRKDQQQRSGIVREAFHRAHQAQAFDVPATITLVLGAVLLLVSIVANLSNSAFGAGVLQIFSGAQLVAALAMWLFGVYLYRGYRRQVDEGRKIPTQP